MLRENVVLRQKRDRPRRQGQRRIRLANPTGPMHVGHCRGAVFGDALCGLLQLRAMTSRANITSTTPAPGRRARALGVPALPRSARRDIGGFPEGLYPGDYLVPVSALAAEHGDKLKAMPELLAADRARQVDRHDDGHDQGRSRRAEHQARRVLLGAVAVETGNNKVTETIDFLRAKGDIYEGRLPPPKGKPVDDTTSRIQTAVPRHRLWRRRRSSADQVGRRLHLFRVRHRLSQEQGRSRLST